MIFLDSNFLYYYFFFVFSYLCSRICTDCGLAKRVASCEWQVANGFQRLTKFHSVKYKILLPLCNCKGTARAARAGSGQGSDLQGGLEWVMCCEGERSGGSLDIAWLRSLANVYVE